LSEASTQAKRKQTLKASRKSERLETRLTVEQKTLVQRAAALQGRSLTDFVLASVQEAAERAIREHDVITLSARDSSTFMEALLHPQPAGLRLREAAKRYKVLRIAEYERLHAQDGSAWDLLRTTPTVTEDEFPITRDRTPITPTPLP